MISREGNLGVLPLDEAVIRPFVKIDLVVAQLAQKGQIAGPVLIRILVSREPSSQDNATVHCGGYAAGHWKWERRSHLPCVGVGVVGEHRGR